MVQLKKTMVEKMIGFVVALQQEAKTVLEKTKAVEKTAKNGKKIYFGDINGKNFALIVCGIGKVNAALSTQFLLDNYPVDFVINFGSVGGIKEKTQALKYYAVDKCCQYDFDLSALDNVPVGYIQDYGTVYFYPKTDKLKFLPLVGLATSDRFTEKKADISTISDLKCEIFDMEGGAVAQVCTANGKTFYIFKGVTDVHGSGNDKNTFYENLNKVCAGFYPVLAKLLSE